MPHYILTFIALVLFFSAPTSAQDVDQDVSQSNAEESALHGQDNKGLAMHGRPKYSASAKHLDYANPQAPKGGHIKMAAMGSFDTLNPYAIKGKAAMGLNLTYDRLMARVWDEPFTMYPLIAERIEVAPDRSAVTFHLNPKARFHDGSPITAEDVIFSFETLRDLGRPNMRRIYKLVDTAQKTGARSVHFTFGAGHDEETVMILAMMPILSKAWWAGRNFDETLLESPNLNGPYRIKSVDPARSITYERVADYWAADLLTNVGHHNFDEVTYEYYRDQSVALEAFNKGDLNLHRESDVTKWISAYAKSKDITMSEIPHQRPARMQGFIFNMRRAPFDDIRVRKALSLAFDDEWLGKNLFHDRFKRIDSFFANSALSSAQAQDSTEPSPPPPTTLRTRLREASALLKEAGWLVKDGVHMKDGQSLTFEILLGSPRDEKIALNFKKSLERLGITMNVRIADAALFQKRRQDYDYDMLAYHWQNSLSPGTEQHLYWSCEAANQPARWNFSGLCNAEVDELTAQIAQAQNYEDLTAHARALDRILMSKHIAIPLFYKDVDYVAYHKPVTAPQNTPLYGMVLETWWMDRGLNENDH